MSWVRGLARRRGINLVDFHRWLRRRLPAAQAARRDRLWLRYQRLLARLEGLEARMCLGGAHGGLRCRINRARREARAALDGLMGVYRASEG